MNRLLVALATAVLLALLGADVVGAQEPVAETPTVSAAQQRMAEIDARWPAYPLNGHQAQRGPGWYFALWKIGLLYLTFLVWCRTTDWVSRDVNHVGLPYAIWNPVVFFPFVVGFFLFALLVPWFLLGYPLLLVAYFVPLGIYIHRRNGLVDEADKVLTKDHIMYLISHMGRGMGAEISTEKKLPHEKGAPVVFHALGAESEQKNQANLIEARQSPAYITLKDIVADALNKRAEKVLLDYTAENVGVKYQIDGVWHDLPPRERAATDPVAAVMKKMANLNMADRKSKQEGAFQAEYQGQKYLAALASQGTPTGERVVLTLAGKAKKFESLEELGMREKMRAQLKEFLARNSGVIILSAMPQGGLSSMLAMTLKSTDRLLRDFVSIGDKTKHEPEVENVEVVTFDAAAGQTHATVLPKTILRQPDVLVVRDIADADTLKILLAQSAEDHPKLSVVTLRAKEASEAILRLLALKVPATELAPHLVCSLNGRLIRKLCDNCKEPYEPTPEMLARLGIPAGRVQTLYRERQPLPPESKQKRPPCPNCNDLGYFGRTAIFELLVVDDKLRQALIKEPKLETVKKVAKASGHRSLQEEGIALVALGITSISELQRVLKQ